MTYHLWAAVIMGLAGSLHCIGMCGPLVGLMPYDRSSVGRFVLTKSLNHLGRISMYALLGVLFGALGQTLVAVGLQQGLSIVSGIFILVIFAWPSRWKRLSPKSKLIQITAWVKSKFSGLLKSKKPSTLFLLGALNGMLPCGLLYMALAASISTGSISNAVLFMIVFGLGTVPALVLVGIFAQVLKQKLSGTYMRFSRILLILTAALLILRGSNLGIPYLSPKVNTEKAQMECCHKPM